MSESVTSKIICPTLIGRADCFATLQSIIEGVKHGKGHLSLISGEAGIGKSRLITEAKTYAATQDFLVPQGNCFPADFTFPYAPLLDLLPSFFVHFVPSSIQVDKDTLPRHLFPLLPHLFSDPNI